MPRATPKESTVVKKIRLAIQNRKPHKGWARKSHGGPNAQGWPDLVCVYRGYPLMIEVKVPGKERTLTKLQAATLAELRAAGAIAVVASSVDKVVRIMDRIDQIKDRR